MLGIFVIVSLSMREMIVCRHYYFKLLQFEAMNYEFDILV